MLLDQGLFIIEVSRSHTTHNSRQDASGRVISPSQRPLPDNTQNSQQTDIHASRGIRTCTPHQASGHRPTPQSARLLTSAFEVMNLKYLPADKLHQQILNQCSQRLMTFIPSFKISFFSNHDPSRNQCAVYDILTCLYSFCFAEFSFICIIFPSFLPLGLPTVYTMVQPFFWAKDHPRFCGLFRGSQVNK